MHSTKFKTSVGDPLVNTPTNLDNGLTTGSNLFKIFLQLSYSTGFKIREETPFTSE